MKKILAIALSVLMLVSLTACGASKPADDGKYNIGKERLRALFGTDRRTLALDGNNEDW